MSTYLGDRSFTLALASLTWLSVASASLLGCKATPDPRFPSRDEIAALTEAPPPATIKVGDDVDPASWQLTGPLPEALSDAPEGGGTPWGQTILAAAAKRPGVLLATQAMECVARESAAFALGHDHRLPGRAIRRFIAGRCGVPTSYLSLGSAWVSGVAASKSDADAFASLQGEAEKMLGAIHSGTSFAGLGFARSGDKAAVVLATTTRRLRLEALPVVQTGASVTLRGELFQGAERLRALVTAGAFGFQACTSNLAIDLPRFELTCPLTPGDAATTVELVGFPTGRMLGDSLLDVTVFSAAPSLAFAGSTAADRAAPASKDALLGALTEQVNTVRKQAGLRALRVSTGQSKTADALAPYYFSAITGGISPLIADKIALGMMAGWDVEGGVREGHFSSGAYPHLDPARLLEDLSARPFGRETLFDPEAGAVALGILPTADGALGAVIGTYASFDGADSTRAEASQALARLTALRKAKGLAAPHLVPEIDQDARRAATRVGDGDALKDALDGMTQGAVTHVQSGGVQGFALSASAVKDLDFPSDLLTLPNLPLALAVAHHKPAGSPWTQLVLFVVVVHLDGPATARAGHMPHG